MQKIKVGIIGIRGLPARYGAFDQFVNQFVDYTNLKKKEIKFYISAERGHERTNIENVHQFYFYRGKSVFILLNNFISIIYFYLRGVRTFLFFGYGPVIFFPLLNLLQCKIICNVDGIEWRRVNSRTKKNYFKFCEKFLSKVKVSLIFDSLVVKRYYGIIHKLSGVLLYYPSDFEQKKIPSKKKNFSRNYKVIAVMRFLPENNIETIVDTFVELNDKNFSNHTLYLVGKENDYFNKIIKPKIKNSKNIIFLGPIYNRNELYDLWSSSDYYIHGHSVGGTNPTLIEAISLKLPIIAYNCSFNKKVLGANGLFFKNSKELFEIIKDEIFIDQNLKIDSSLFKKDFINDKYIELIKSP
tara:strand:+ start:27 stop:1091 length:1065 start_codon:yes stop_codon:yes gene_type:complete